MTISYDLSQKCTGKGAPNLRQKELLRYPTERLSFVSTRQVLLSQDVPGCPVMSDEKTRPVPPALHFPDGARRTERGSSNQIKCSKASSLVGTCIIHSHLQAQWWPSEAQSPSPKILKLK